MGPKGPFGESLQLPIINPGFGYRPACNYKAPIFSVIMGHSSKGRNFKKERPLDERWDFTGNMGSFEIKLYEISRKNESCIMGRLGCLLSASALIEVL